MASSTRRALGALVAVTVLATAGCGTSHGSASHRTATTRPVPAAAGASLGHEGRWFTDGDGRVILLRGVNFVEKWAPYTPEAAGFGDDDAALLARSGFNTVRLGVVFGFLMPAPGRIDGSYLASIARTVDVLGRHGLHVLLDFHQDGWGPVTHGNGMPAWATLTDGRPNPPAQFPLYYVQNPAMQRAFDNFWANRRGPDGVPLQTHYADAMRAVAARLASSPDVLGYEAMNEPWPGTTWSPCLKGCPDLERKLLVPFYTRMAAAVRAADPSHPLFVEPFVLFNFGNAATSLPGRGSPDVLSTHVYATSETLNGSVMDHTVAAAVRDGTALLVTEWGAVDDTATIDHTADQFDARLVSWLYWSYDGHVVKDANRPLVAPNLDGAVLDALTRPYPTAVNGTPTRLSFDTTTAELRFSYDTVLPDGRPAPPGLDTVLAVPAGRYPHGYRASAAGATVTSAPCSPALTLRNDPHATAVSLTVTAAPCR